MEAESTEVENTDFVGRCRTAAISEVPLCAKDWVSLQETPATSCAPLPSERGSQLSLPSSQQECVAFSGSVPCC